jgi:anaphase-promoting complex subunit 10
VIRFFVDYQEDESYTPTKIVFKSGTSENNLIEFATMNLDSPFGWQDVPISGAGGDPDGNTLVSYVLQMQILENHQNGKDTHLRGIKIYAFDPDSGQGGRTGGIAQEVADLVANAGHPEGDDSETRDRLSEMARTLASARIDSGDAAFSVPDFMREPELR